MIVGGAQHSAGVRSKGEQLADVGVGTDQNTVCLSCGSHDCFVERPEEAEVAEWMAS